MTDKERLQHFLTHCNEYELKDIIAVFVQQNKCYKAHDVIEIVNELNQIIMEKTLNLEVACALCYERGVYIRDYLEGKTWKTEEDAKKNVQPQIDNAKMIVSTCNEAMR